MSCSVEYNKKLIEDAILENEGLTVLPEMRDQIVQVSKVISSFVGINDLAIRGYFWKVIKGWELENEKTANYIYESNLKEQKRILQGLLRGVGKYLEGLLRDPSDKEKLKKAMNAVYKHYL